MPFTTADFDRTVGKLRMVPTKGKKHQIYWLEHNGKKILWTMRSHGRGDLGRVENIIKRQLSVSAAQLRDLANCPMTRDAYISHLRNLNLIEDNKQQQ